MNGQTTEHVLSLFSVSLQHKYSFRFHIVRQLELVSAVSQDLILLLGSGLKCEFNCVRRHGQTNRILFPHVIGLTSDDRCCSCDGMFKPIAVMSIQPRHRLKREWASPGCQAQWGPHCFKCVRCHVVRASLLSSDAKLGQIWAIGLSLI